MTSVCLAFFPLLTLLVLVYLIIWSSRQGARARTAILCLTLLHETVIVVFPTFYALFTDFYLEAAISSKPGDLLEVLIGEFMFIAMFAIGLQHGVPFRKSTNGPYRAVYAKSEGPATREGGAAGYETFLLVLVVLTLLLFIFNMFSQVLVGSEYFATIDGNITASSLTGKIYLILEKLFSFAGFLAAVSLINLSSSQMRWPWIYKSAGLTVLALIMMTSLSLGVRGRIVWIFCAVLFFSYATRNKRLAILGGIILICSVLVFAFFTGIKGNVAQWARQNVSRTELIQLILKEGLSHSEGETPGVGDMLENLALRAQAPRNSTILYDLYQEGNGLGLKHYLASLAPIPKFIWKNKPLAGSIDETIYGRAIYLVMRLGYGTTFNMGPILASAHAYWEGGWPWLIFLGLILGLFWDYYLTLCENLSAGTSVFFAVIPMGAFLVDGFFTALMPFHDIIHFCWLTVLPVYLLYRIVGFAAKQVRFSEVGRG